MFIIIGAIIVVVCIAGGYAMHHGPFGVLWQPNEVLIIGGASLGSAIIMAPVHVLKEILHGIIGLLKGKAEKPADYKALLVTQFELFRLASYEGGNGLEPHVEGPDSSEIFKKNPALLADHHTLEFLCDTLKVVIIGGVPEHQIAELADLSIETHDEEAHHAPSVLTKVGDSLPGMGIVAAVLGIIITMQHIDGEASEIGMSVAAALVGTFLGILAAYGFVGPISTHMEFRAKADRTKLICIRAGILAYARGLHPLICVEFARRSLPSHLRPTFSALEEACREVGR